MRRRIFFFSCCIIFGSTGIQGATPSSSASVPAISSRIQVDSVKYPAPWTSLAVADQQNRFRFAVMTDRTDGARPGVFEKAVAKVNLLMPDFVINIGDLIQGYTKDTVELTTEWNEVEGFLKQLKMPFFHVPGNHDIENDVESRLWTRRFGDKTYHFTYKNVLFVCMNSIDSGYGNLTAGQLASIGAVLKDHADVRWTFIFMHMPLWDAGYKKEAGWGAMEKLLGNRPYTAFAGHYHQYTLQQNNGRDLFTLATTGGSSALRGPVYGEFDHIAWVTMTDKEPVIANVMLDGVQDKYIRTADMRMAIDSFMRPGNCAIKPVLFAGRECTGGKTAFTVRNPLSWPVRISLGITAADPLVSLTYDGKEKILAPRTSGSFPISLAYKNELVIDDRIAAKAHWNATICMKDTMRLSGEMNVALVKPLSCARAGKPVIVDGKLDDWPVLPFECVKPMQMRKAIGKWRGPGDSHFTFGACYDSVNLYLGVKVVDDTVIAPKEFSWEHDCVEMHLYFQPDSVRPFDREGTEPGFFVIAVNPPASDKDTARAFPWTMPRRTKYAARRTADGYAVEASVPIAQIDSTAGKNWDGFRLNVAVDDRDNGDVATIWWRPGPDAENWYPDEGWFVKAR